MPLKPLTCRKCVVAVWVLCTPGQFFTSLLNRNGSELVMYYVSYTIERSKLGASSLRQYIDNRDRRLRVDLRPVTFALDLYNIKSGEKFSWGEGRRGLSGFAHLRDVIEKAGPSTTIAVSKLNGLITLTVADGWEVLTDSFRLRWRDRWGVARRRRI